MTQFVCWKNENGSENGIRVESIQLVEIDANGKVDLYVEDSDLKPITLTGDNAERFAHWWRNKDGVYYL